MFIKLCIKHNYETFLLLQLNQDNVPSNHKLINPNQIVRILINNSMLTFFSFKYLVKFITRLCPYLLYHNMFHNNGLFLYIKMAN